MAVRKKRGHIPARKVKYGTLEFDSKTEVEYYFYLRDQKDIKRITLQPQYSLLEPFSVPCDKCLSGKVKSPKTGRMIQCGACKGTGKRIRQGWNYTADFKVEYQDGRKEVIDVKGGWNNERFPQIKKMFEYTYKQQLVVVKKDKEKGWVRS